MSIQIKNLTKYYGSFKAVNDISFEVPDKEIIGFLGPNGAGKSTTMNIITGFIPASAGEITINGYNIETDPKNAKRQIGFLPEIPPLYVEMKVREYLKFVAGIKEVPREKVASQIEYAMDKLKITDRAGQVIRSLSKGYRQRVGFAQALLGDPKILILDEPTVGLDPSQIIEVRQLIKDLKKDRSVILSTHILAEVSAVCDRAIIISQGEIRANDTLANLSKMSEKNTVITMSVEGGRDGITKVLKTCAGIIRIADIEQIEYNVYEYKIEIKDDSARKEILKKLLDADHNVSQIKVSQTDLEDIFVRLTKPVEKKSSIQKIRELADEIDKENADAEEKNV